MSHPALTHVFFGGTNILNRLIQWRTASDWDHCGVVLDKATVGTVAAAIGREPIMADNAYLLESTLFPGAHDIFKGRKVGGVQIVGLTERLARYKGDVGFRQSITPLSIVGRHRLVGFIRDHYGQPYELNLFRVWAAAADWLEIFIKGTRNQWHCSELAAGAAAAGFGIKPLLDLEEYTPLLDLEEYTPEDLANYNWMRPYLSPIQVARS